MNEFIRYDFDDDINIYPIFDPHYGSVNHCEREFRQYLKIILDDPVGFTVLGGDLVNNNIGNMICWEDTESPHRQLTDMVELLRPLAEKNRILCSVRGNHEFRTMKNSYIDSSSIIMSKLDLSDRYRPDIAFLSIGIGKRDHGKNGARSATRYIVGVCHGFGGGLKTGSTVNRAEDFWAGYEGVDVGITGHTHRPFMETKAKQIVDRHNAKMTMHHQVICVASSWMDSTEGYPIQKGYPAASTCIVQKITLHKPLKMDKRGSVTSSFRNIDRAVWESTL